ncbi:Ig-like domain-containing protein [Methanobrevibacter thaueri]|uniref:Bacterial Ig-like domain protein n=1 Tax=Methanobrevibacter thaueri TaxID=190975 RepID=A0A315XKD0_9EURY|nr:Ig-like domain-containing protein [Methanobrevibacter thaueri]PWB85489.1 hypothetical protein MBBTH_17530 [Methanobrevibacter thaueri]
MIMIKKSWIIMALLIMLVFCVGSVSATDDVNDTVGIDENTESVDTSIDAVDNSDLQSYQDEDNLSTRATAVNANDWSTLERICERGNGPFEINLTGSIYNADSDINFLSDVTIIGNENAYITGGNSNLIPFINDDSSFSIIFLNVHFKDMSVNNLMKLKGYNKFENCTFTNIVASSNTNNVLWNNGDLMEITGCNFTNCTTGRGVVSNYDSAGSNTAQMVVNNSNFNGNYARSYAGAINNRGILNVNNSNFVNNAANSWAGAINGVANTETYITNSKFKNNVAGWNGGALYTYCILEVHNSIFEGNNCTTNNGGGAIGAYNFVSTYNITIDSCNFTNNINLCKAYDNLSTTSLGRGGAISVLNGGYLDVHNSRFVNNYARIGQAIAAATYNYANATGGVPHISIYNNQFINHTGNNDTVYITGNDIIFTNNTFVNSVQTISYSSLTNQVQNVFSQGEDVLGAVPEETLSGNMEVVYIDSVNGDWLNDGKTPETAFDQLSDGFTMVKDGGTIYIADGTYNTGKVYPISSVNANCVALGNNAFIYLISTPIKNDASNKTITFINLNFAYDTERNIAIDFGKNCNFINCTFIGNFTIGKSLADEPDQAGQNSNGFVFTRYTTFENCVFKDATGSSFITMYKCANVTFNNCNFTNINVDSLIYRPSFDNLYYDEANWEWKVIENQSGTCYFEEDGLVLNNCSFLGCTYNGIVDSAADFYEVVEITGCNYDNAVTPGVTTIDNHNYINSTDILPSSLTVSVGDIIYGNNFTINVKLDVPVTDIVYVTINKKEYSVNVVNGSGSLNVSDKLDANNYNVSAVFEGTSLYEESNATSNFTVSPVNTGLTASDVAMVYNSNAKTMTVQATNIADGSIISVKVNGKTLTGTVKNGKAIITIPANLAAKTYPATITFDGDANYNSATASAKVVVSKATPKLTAKKATFKAKKKTKKYSIILKDNKNKALSKVKVTLKVKGKTYKATTNTKGKAIFKISKLTKKGTHKAKVKFAGNANFKAVSKTVKIKVKK